MSFVVKNTTRISILDLIAPFTCRGCGARGAALCECCKKHNIKACPKICPRCGKNHKKCSCEVPVYVVGFREGVLKQIVEDYKFQSIRASGRDLAELIDGVLPEMSNVVVVPLPTISRHIRERGFDHTRLIAKHLVRLRNRHELKSSWRLVPLLERKNNTVQVGSDRNTRLQQAKEAYELNSRFLKSHPISPDLTYLLLDDIWTTGASMESAIKILQKTGAKKGAGAVLLMPRPD